MENPKYQTPNPNPQPYDLKERSFLFAVRMIRVAASLPQTAEAQVLRRQIAPSGTSIIAKLG
jgi:hypothetical protein